jgi:hypothetical protein
VVSSDAANFRYPAVVLAALTVAALLLLNALQFSFHARRHLWSAEDVHAWFPDVGAHAQWEDHQRQKQADGYDIWKRWASCAAGFYNGGIVALLVGLAFALPPISGEGAAQLTRWISFWIALVAALVETGWTLISYRRDRR